MHEAAALAGLGLMKIKIKAGSLLQEAPDPGRSIGKGGKVIWCTLRLFGDIKADHRDIPAGCKHGVCRIGIIPDIGLCAIGDIAMTRRAAPHHHNSLCRLRDGRIMIECSGQICQRPDSADCHLARMRGAGLAQKLCGTARIRTTCRMHCRQIAKPFGSMYEIGGRRGITASRNGSTSGDGHTVMRHLGQGHGVAGCLIGAHITENCCHANDVKAGIGKGKMNGHRIIYAGVGIDYQLLGHAGKMSRMGKGARPSARAPSDRLLKKPVSLAAGRDRRARAGTRDMEGGGGGGGGHRIGNIITGCHAGKQISQIAVTCPGGIDNINGKGWLDKGAGHAMIGGTGAAKSDHQMRNTG